MRNFERLLWPAKKRVAGVIVFLLLAGVIAGSVGFAQEKSKPVVKKIGVTRYRLAEIEFDAKTREIFIPVVVNKREGGPMEYILVHENGKVHESILTTKASPLTLQIVLKLLKYQSGNGDVFNLLLPEDERKAKGGKKKDRGNLLETAIHWADSETAKLVNDVILDAKTSEAMSPGGWIYTGSEIDGGNYMAELEGSIIAVYLDTLSMFNMTREGADDDERWGANPDAIPEIGTRGTLVLKLSK